jgi:hypothetical protein
MRFKDGIFLGISGLAFLDVSGVSGTAQEGLLEEPDCGCAWTCVNGDQNSGNGTCAPGVWPPGFVTGSCEEAGGVQQSPEGGYSVLCSSALIEFTGPSRSAL